MGIHVHRGTGMRYAFILALAVPLVGQDSRFDVRSRLVLVPVTVTDAKGRSVDGLESADFIVRDGQRERKVTVDTLGTGVARIALVIAVQSSGISTPVLEKVRKIGVMIQPIITGERGCAAVVSFDKAVKWLQDCTNDADAVGRALGHLQAGEHKDAAMLDAVGAAIEHLRKQPNARRVLLLISEARDRGSETKLEAATVAAQSAGVTIYAMTYSAVAAAFTSKAPLTRQARPKSSQTTPEGEVMATTNGAPPSKYNPYSPKLVPENQSIDLPAAIRELLLLHQVNTARALTAVTGGTAFPFTRQKGLENAIQKLGVELHSQYVVSFAPEDAAAGYHPIDVSVVRGGTFTIRARPGYWTESAATAR